MKLYYNIIMVPTEDTVELLGALIKLGNDGWKFVGWTPEESKGSKGNGWRAGIFIKDS